MVLPLGVKPSLGTPVIGAAEVPSSFWSLVTFMHAMRVVHPVMWCLSLVGLRPLRVPWGSGQRGRSRSTLSGRRLCTVQAPALGCSLGESGR
jgi:hypothetical protein